MRVHILFLLALSSASSLAAEVQVTGPVEHGVFAAQIKDAQPGERILTRSDQRIEPGEVVPARLGTKFGVRYQLTNKQANDTPLTLLYLTPGVITPDGKRHDKFEVMQNILPEASQEVMAFEFTEHYELVPGEWQFMVFQGDRKLLEQRFMVR
jgi:hypothetical protein